MPRAAWVIGALLAGLVLAHLKLHIFAGAIGGKLCEVSDTCAPEDLEDGDVGFLALAGIAGYLYYPASLVVALFVPKPLWPAVLLAVCAILVPLGLGLDLIGFGIVLVMTMLFAMVALWEVVAIGVAFAGLHSVLVVLVLGRLNQPGPPEAGRGSRPF